MPKKEQSIEEYTKEYNARNRARVREKLLESFPPEEAGLWLIMGESPDPSSYGGGYEPIVDIVEGHYEKAVEYALEQPKFFSWGGGEGLSKREIQLRSYKIG